MSQQDNTPSEKLASILSRAGLPFRSCHVGPLGTVWVVCYGEEMARRIAHLLQTATFKLRGKGITKSLVANKEQKGTRLCERHEEYTVHAKCP